WCVGDCALNGICRLTQDNKKNKGSLTIAGSKQRLPFLCCLWFEEVLTFPHNLAPVSVLYLSERLEMSSHGEKSKKAITTKPNQSKEQKDETYNENISNRSRPGCEHFTGVECGQTVARNNPDHPGRVPSHPVPGQL